MELQCVFEWDERKRLSNARKHGFDFRDAHRLFHQPLVVSADVREEYGEDRWMGIGLLDARIVVISFVILEVDAIRLISMRKATREERRKYEEEIAD